MKFHFHKDHVLYSTYMLYSVVLCSGDTDAQKTDVQHVGNEKVGVMHISLAQDSEK